MTDPLDAQERAELFTRHLSTHRCKIGHEFWPAIAKDELAEQIRQAEQSAREKALEEAADACDRKLAAYPKDNLVARTMALVFEEMGQDIRALKEKP